MKVAGAHAAIIAQLSIREMAHDQAIREPGSSILAPPASLGHFEPNAIEEQKRAADVVVRGSAGAHLFRRSEPKPVHHYAIEEATVLVGGRAGRDSDACVVPPTPVLTVFGGDVPINGIRIHDGNTNSMMRQADALYLLFLRVSGEAA